MKKLTHEEIKALPKGTKVLVKGIFDLADYNRSYPYYIYVGGLMESFSQLSEIYLPDQSEEQLQPLPEEMPKEFAVMVGGMGNAKYLWAYLRENFGTAPREWWMDLKPGDKFRSRDGATCVFTGKHRIGYGHNMASATLPVEDCRPYTEPTEEEKFIASLSPEQKEAYKKLKHG